MLRVPPETQVVAGLLHALQTQGAVGTETWACESIQRGRCLNCVDPTSQRACPATVSRCARSTSGGDEHRPGRND
eukprot:416756-Alexandrium_andersonii.AAC.1